MALQILLNGLIAGLLYALIALGFSLIYNGTKVFHIAHGAIYTAAVYLFLAWTLVLGSSLTGWSLSVALLLTSISVCLLALLFEISVYRPLSVRRAPPLVTFISSLGLYIIIVNLIALFFGNETKILNPNIEPTITLGDAIVTRMQLIQLIVSSLIILLVFFLLKQTALGRNIRALSDNPILVSVLGINIKRIRFLVLMLGSLLAASASLLKAFDVGVDPHVGLSAVLTAAVAVIIGGANSHFGAVLGALLLGMTQNLVVWFLSAQWQDAMTFVVFILVLLARQDGLLATKLRLEER